LSQESKGLPTIREIIDRFDLSPKKALGQNFLTDLNLTHKIVRLAGNLDGYAVLEVGPGPGSLTRPLLECGANPLVVLEKDRRCVQALDVLKPYFPDRLTICEGDALTVDFTSFSDLPVKVVANLPYNVASQILMKILDHPKGIYSFTLMFQKEVAQRLVAKPGSKAYGILSVFTQYWGSPKIVMDLPPTVFYPPPKVDSAVVHMVLDETPKYPADWASLKKVTHIAFQQRRKMLRVSLKSLFKDPTATLEELGLNPQDRAENLSCQDFCLLADAWQNLNR